jgi:hypothetical protein
MNSNNNRYLGYWTLTVALCISTVAAYYSIVGLAVIFAAALIPVIIMGTVLEIAKITTAVWLHMNWEKAPLLIKTYLTAATVVLMFITSMGIYGFLSKAHIEQNAAGLETQAKLEQIDRNIVAAEASLARINQSIIDNTQRENTVTEDIQSQIDREQSRIDQVIARTQPAIDEQQAIIDKESANRDLALTPVTGEISRIEKLLDQLAAERTQLLSATSSSSRIQSFQEELKMLEEQQSKFMNLLTFSDRTSILELQNLVGTTADGRIGADTRNAIDAYRSRLENSIASVNKQIADETTQQAAEKQSRESRISAIDSDTAQLRNELRELKARYETEVRAESENTRRAREEISRIRGQLEVQIADSTGLINNLRSRLENFDNTGIKNELEKLEKDRQSIQANLDALYQEKFSVESNIRKLEAEIGPVKYIAELIYGDSADKQLLETAVRWVIILLVLVFDPLAIVLVIAGLYVLTNRNQSVNETVSPEERDVVTIAPVVIDTAVVEPKIRKPRQKKTKNVQDVSEPEVSKEEPRTSPELIPESTLPKSDEVGLALEYNTVTEKPASEPKQIVVAPAKSNTIIVRKPK